MSDDNWEDIDLDEQPPEEEGKKKKKAGRPKGVPTSTRGEIDAQFDEIMENLQEQDDDEKPRTSEEIIEFNRLIMTKIQNLLMADLRTVSNASIARIKTPNGISKIEVAGLPRDTRAYLIEIYDLCSKALNAEIEANSDKNKDENKNKFEDLADKLYQGIPGLKVKGKE